VIFFFKSHFVYTFKICLNLNLLKIKIRSDSKNVAKSLMLGSNLGVLGSEPEDASSERMIGWCTDGEIMVLLMNE
jgi:hypothetical protein